MKTVHVVEYGCELRSAPQTDEVADHVVQRLRDKGVECYAAAFGQAEALAFLKDLTPTSGTDANFDYEKGVPKS